MYVYISVFLFSFNFFEIIFIPNFYILYLGEGQVRKIEEKISPPGLDVHMWTDYYVHIIYNNDEYE